MKKLLLTLIIAVAGVFAVMADGRASRDINILPQAARTLLDKQFKADVSLIKTDKTLGRVTEYEVILTDGTEVTFDRAGNWREVEVSRGREVPKYFTPDALRNYVKKNHSSARIETVERKGSGYEVELSDGTDLRFDASGTFLRYD